MRPVSLTLSAHSRCRYAAAAPRRRAAVSGAAVQTTARSALDRRIGREALIAVLTAAPPEAAMPLHFYRSNAALDLS
jgi:hypothetical protein